MAMVRLDRLAVVVDAKGTQMKQIIERAVEGGLNIDGEEFLDSLKTINHFLNDNFKFPAQSQVDISQTFIDSFIFSHDFLRAFFGENTHQNLGWQYYAQKLILSEDRLEYLKGFLK